MTFSDSELSDIRIALQDRINLVQQAAISACDRARPYTGLWSPEHRIEIDRLNAILAKVSR